MNTERINRRLSQFSDIELAEVLSMAREFIQSGKWINLHVVYIKMMNEETGPRLTPKFREDLMYFSRLIQQEVNRRFIRNAGVKTPQKKTLENKVIKQLSEHAKALSELVRIKTKKHVQGEYPTYQQEKEVAWKRAFELQDTKQKV